MDELVKTLTEHWPEAAAIAGSVAAIVKSLGGSLKRVGDAAEKLTDHLDREQKVRVAEAEHRTRQRIHWETNEKRLEKLIDLKAEGILQ